MSFLYPTFLFALAAIAIPVILHLVQLRRARRIEFSNVRFIKASQDVTSSQRKLKDLLILLSRILFIIFLVLAFAQPFLPGSASSAASDKDVTIAIDNSYSMQNLHNEKDVSLLTFALDKGKSIVSLFPSGSFYSVVDNNSTSGNRFPSAYEADAALDNITYSAVSTSSIKSSGDGHLFILSDFQKNKFLPAFLADYDSTTQLHLVPLAAGNDRNLYVDTVYLEDAFIRPGAESVFHFSIYNAGNDIAEDVPVKLIIDDKQVASLSLDLQPKQATAASVNFRVEGKGSLSAYVQIEDFPVEFDNTYFFTLTPSAGVNIVEITDGRNLNLDALYSKEPLFRYSQFQAGNVDYAKASAADLVILNGLQDLNIALATTIGNYMREGGSVLVVPPVSTEAQGYANFFSSAGLPARFVSSGSKTELLAPGEDNRFFRGIFSDYDKNMKMPSAVRKLQWSRASEDILKYRGGASYLSRFDRGKGQVYLMAAPLHEDENSFVNHALLLPVLYKIAISGYKQEQALAYSLTSGTIKLPVTAQTNSEGIYKLEKDSLSYIPEQQMRGGSLYFTVPPGLNEAGIYNLTLEGKTIASLAFNYDHGESQLEQYTPEDLRNLIGSDKKNIHVYDYGDAFSVKNEFEKRYFGVKLWKYCLILCLLFLMAEIALIRFL